LKLIELASESGKMDDEFVIFCYNKSYTKYIKGGIAMSLYKDWQSLAETSSGDKEFWEDYLVKEQAIYERILSDPEEVIKGQLKELSETFNMMSTLFVGFMEGIQSSLDYEIDIAGLEENSNIQLSVDFESLYYNMLEAQAEWLYSLEQWTEILTEDQRKSIKKDYNKSKTIVKEKKIGRNEPCPCGSGKKYKRCCLKND